MQKWKRIEGGPASEIGEPPHYFALRLQKSDIEFYRTLPQATRQYDDECVKAFREYYKGSRFQGTAGSPSTATRGKTDRFSKRFKAVVFKILPNGVAGH